MAACRWRGTYFGFCRSPCRIRGRVRRGFGLAPILTNAIPFILLLLFWVFAPGVLPYWNARKLYASQIFLREPISYTFNSENFSGNGPSASWSIAWSVLKTVHETKSLFLLYHHRNIAVIVPKRFFGSEAEMAAWRQLVLTSFAPHHIKPPGIVGAWC